MGSDYAGYTGAEEAAMPALASDMGAEETGTVTWAQESVTEAQESVLAAENEVAGDDADTEAGEEENIVTEASSSTGQSRSGEKRYKCTVCEKSFKTKQYYRHHQRSHLFGPEWKCGSCDLDAVLSHPV